MSWVLRFLEAAVLHGTAVALAIWGLERLLRSRITPALSAALWTVALLKFLVPMGWSPATARPTVVFEALVLNGQGSAQSPSVSGWPWSLIIVTGYAVAVLALAARQGVARWRLARLIATLPPADSGLMQSVRAAAALLELSAVPTVRVGAGPLLFGLWRPTLVVPAKPPLAMLVHELAHLRRRDHWVLAVQQIAQVLFFFWPVVRWVNRQLEHHRELACDQLALEHGALSAAAYARLLLEAHRSSPGLAFGALEMAARTSRLERRIGMLLKLSGRRSWKWAVVTVSCAGALALTGTALAADGGLLRDPIKGGTIDAAEVEKVVAANRSTIVACFEAQRTWSPMLTGTLVYDFDINADGAVGAGCRGEGSTFSPELAYQAEDALTRCIARALGKWKFPAPRGGAVGVSWPFTYVQQPPPLRSP